MSDTKPRRVALSALVVVAVLGAPVIAASDHSTLGVEDRQVAAGETTTVAVTLSAIPDGLSGFNVTVELRDPGAATITGAAANETFGLREATIVDDGSAVRLKAVDVDQQVQPGDGPVRLGTVNVSADTDAGTELALRVDQVDDDDGGRVAPATDAGRIGTNVESTPAVDNQAGGAGRPPTEGDRPTIPPVVAAVLGALGAVVCTAGFLRFRD